MIEERRHDQADGAYLLAILYTVGYFAFLGCLMFVPIPAQNKELLLTLAGILSAAQLGIVKYFYDGSKSADKVQTANIARSVRSESVVQDIAKAAAPSAAAAVSAATGQPIVVAPAPAAEPQPAAPEPVAPTAAPEVNQPEKGNSP